MESPLLGIIAGGGQFPILCARSAKALGRKVFAVAHSGETDPILEDEVDSIIWIKIGQLGKLIKALKKKHVSEALFAGTITKKRIFFDIFPDMKAISLWNRLDRRLDDSILREVAEELKKEGIQVIPATAFLQELYTPEGTLTKREPSKAEWEDIYFGWDMAKGIGRLDIGQCVVVKDKTVLAVEAMEGTDATIIRAGRLGGPGSVVIKICKPGQDERFDLPSIGISTIETMKEARAKVLAVEAGKSLFFDREASLSFADKMGMAVVGMKGKE